LGKVFPLIDPKTGKPYAVLTVGPVVSEIGRKAGVVVGESEKVERVDGRLVRRPVKQFAGAHDLRRAFCTRWAMKVKTPVLQRLARHAHISTTMGYYVHLTADEIGDDLWAAQRESCNPPEIGNTSCNTGHFLARKKKGGKSALSHCLAREYRSGVEHTGLLFDFESELYNRHNAHGYAYCVIFRKIWVRQ
jgi:hypothetical protein